MAVQIGGSQANGYSSGDAINALKEAAAKTLPAGYTYDWAGQSREELKAGSQTIMILGLGLVFVFLILAALYESWKVPFAVLFSGTIWYDWCFFSSILVELHRQIFLS